MLSESRYSFAIPIANETMAVITEIEDLRLQAKKRVAKAIFGYVDSGSCNERTIRTIRTIGANRSDLDAIHLRQRVAVFPFLRFHSTFVLRAP